MSVRLTVSSASASLSPPWPGCRVGFHREPRRRDGRAVYERDGTDGFPERFHGLPAHQSAHTAGVLMSPGRYALLAVYPRTIGHLATARSATGEVDSHLGRRKRSQLDMNEAQITQAHRRFVNGGDGGSSTQDRHTVGFGDARRDGFGVSARYASSRSEPDPWVSV